MSSSTIVGLEISLSAAASSTTASSFPSTGSPEFLFLESSPRSCLGSSSTFFSSDFAHLSILLTFTSVGLHKVSVSIFFTAPSSYLHRFVVLLILNLGLRPPRIFSMSICRFLFSLLGFALPGFVRYSTVCKSQIFVVPPFTLRGDMQFTILPQVLGIGE